MKNLQVRNRSKSQNAERKRLLFQEQFETLKTNQQNVQQRMKFVLQHAIQKFRKYTKIKNMNLLSKQQLLAFNDLSSSHSNQQSEKVSSQFEKQYYQYKQQNISIQFLVSNLLILVRNRKFTSFQLSHPLLIIWSFIKFLIVLHLCFIFPLSDSFVYLLDDFLTFQKPLLYIEVGVLILDIILRLNTQIYNQGVLITQTKKIIQFYMRKEFYMDFLSVAGLIFFIFSEFQPLKYIFIFRLKELSNFQAVFKYEIDVNGKFKNHLKLITLLITVVLLAHCFACLWIGIGQHSTSNNWINERGLDDSNWIEIYLNGLYFVITTMTTVGYGDIIPVNIYEVITCICLTLFSSCIFAYIFNTITSILKDFDAKKSKVKHDVEILNRYMKKKNIDTDLQKRVENYLRLVYKHQPSTKVKKIFNKLSPQLKLEINEQDKGVLLLKQPFLVNNFSLKFIRELIEHVQERNLTPKEKVQNDQGLNILMKGDIKILFGENMTEVGRIKPGDNLGAKTLFNTSFDKRLQNVSEEFSTLYMISQNDFFKHLKDADLEQYFQIKEKLQQQSYDNLYQKCVLCRKPGHELCEEICFTINRELVLRKHQYSIQQKRKIGFKRKTQRKQKALSGLQQKKEIANLCYQNSFKFLGSQNQVDCDQGSDDSDSYDDLELTKGCLDENKEQISVSYEKPDLKGNMKKQKSSFRLRIKGNSIVRMMRNFTTQKVWHDDFFIINDFDKMKQFRMYYPTQNYDQVIRYYNHLRKKLNRTICKSIL